MRLQVYSALMSKQYIGFIVFNIILGLALIAGLVRTNEFFIVTNLFNYAFWGLLFMLVGVGQLSSYILNSFTWMRIFLVFGLTLQTFWSIALGARQLEELNANLFLLLFFLLIAYFKFYLYLYFPSQNEVDRWTET